MILKNIVDLKQSIEDKRIEMYESIKNTDKSDSDVIKISQQLDTKILRL
ncbi:aspartyl-phosphate phosphatase Spo0E family protein [Peribacillus simplex]|nr:aspartyl-phosphate phosphatase Spo0E family protein [Peribacillus simplex]